MVLTCHCLYEDSPAEAARHLAAATAARAFADATVQREAELDEAAVEAGVDEDRREGEEDDGEDKEEGDPDAYLCHVYMTWVKIDEGSIEYEDLPGGGRRVRSYTVGNGDLKLYVWHVK